MSVEDETSEPKHSTDLFVVQVDQYEDDIGHDNYSDQVSSLSKLPQSERDKLLESGYWSYCSGSTRSTSSSKGCRSNRCSAADNLDAIKEHVDDTNTVSNEAQHNLLFLKKMQDESPSKDLIGKYFERKTFAAAFLTSEGGTIKISEQGVSLYVPPGAISKDIVQLVYISIASTDVSLPDLKANQKWVTAIVDCGPSGLQFQKQVLISLPRTSQHKSHGNPRVTVHRSSNENDWEKLRPCDHEWDTTKGRILIKTTHFTRFGVSEEQESDSDEDDYGLVTTKWMKIAAFIKPSGEHEGCLEITVKICDHKAYEVSDFLLNYMI